MRSRDRKGGTAQRKPAATAPAVVVNGAAVYKLTDADYCDVIEAIDAVNEARRQADEIVREAERKRADLMKRLGPVYKFNPYRMYEVDRVTGSLVLVQHHG